MSMLNYRHKTETHCRYNKSWNAIILYQVDCQMEQGGWNCWLHSPGGGLYQVKIHDIGLDLSHVLSWLWENSSSSRRLTWLSCRFNDLAVKRSNLWEHQYWSSCFCLSETTPLSVRMLKTAAIDDIKISRFLPKHIFYVCFTI